MRRQRTLYYSPSDKLLFKVNVILDTGYLHTADFRGYVHANSNLLGSERLLYTSSPCDFMNRIDCNFYSKT